MALSLVIVSSLHVTLFSTWAKITLFFYFMMQTFSAVFESKRTSTCAHEQHERHVFILKLPGWIFEVSLRHSAYQSLPRNPHQI